jgi:hypothetical protein
MLAWHRCGMSSDTRSLTLLGLLTTNTSEARGDSELAVVVVVALRFEASPLRGSSAQSRKAMLRLCCRLMLSFLPRFSSMKLSQSHESRASKGTPLED